MKTLALAIALVLCGCEKNNPYFCKDHPDNNCLLDGSGSNQACTGPGDCAGVSGMPVCDLAMSPPVCVQCTATDHTQCTGMNPICGSDDKCHGCTTQADCGGSGACLPDGSCGPDSQVAWVAPGGVTTGDCPQATPCATLDYAVNNTSKPFVHVHGVIPDKLKINRSVTIVADPNAALVEPSAQTGTLLEVDGGTVEIYYLTISGAQGLGSSGLSIPSNNPSVTLHRVKLVGNAGGAVNATATGASLTMDKCEVVNNPGGGLYLSRITYDIENTFITGNGVMGGSTETQFGGVFVSLPTTQSIFAFNTVAKNFAMTGASAGVLCGSSVKLQDSILYDNTTAQVGPMVDSCVLSYSDVGPGTYTGDHVINTPPGFMNETGGNFHITSGSPAAGAGDPAAVQPLDFDGDTRPMGAPDRDMGADEVQ